MFEEGSSLRWTKIRYELITRKCPLQQLQPHKHARDSRVDICVVFCVWLEMFCYMIWLRHHSSPEADVYLMEKVTSCCRWCLSCFELSTSCLICSWMPQGIPFPLWPYCTQCLTLLWISWFVFLCMYICFLNAFRNVFTNQSFVISIWRWALKWQVLLWTVMPFDFWLTFVSL